MSTAVTPNLNSISLYLKAGTSDKEYHLEILGDETKGFTVQYRYGKRGSTLKVGVKNKLPIMYSVARTIFDEILKEKLKEGYLGTVAGTPYQIVKDAGKESGVLPQLLNAITEAQALALLEDNEWIMQEKKDGERRLIRWNGKKAPVEGIKRNGELVSLPEPLADKIKEIGINLLSDGELVKETYWLVDLLAIGKHAIGPRPYEDRLEEINSWLGDEFNDTNFRMVPTAIGTAAKKALWQELRARKAEGVVFTRKSSAYAVGRPHSMGDRLKFKFVESATVRVHHQNNNVRSVGMEVLKEGDWVPVGDVTIYPNFNVPAVGAIIEVQYLNYNQDGSIYQPVYLGERTDVGEEACLHSQLKVKAPEPGEEEES